MKSSLFLPCCMLPLFFAAMGQSPAASVVVAHYGMGEAEVAGGTVIGTTATTLIAGPGSNMTDLTGTPTVGSGGAPNATGGSTAYMNFDGVQERYQISPGILPTNSTAWMIEAWVRPQAGGTGLGFIVSHGHGGAGQALNYDAATGLYGWFVGGVGQFNGSIAASGVGTTWDHVALVRESNMTTLYVNGTVAGFDGAAGTFPYANGSAIGSQYTGGGDHGFTGDIDEVYFSTVSNFNPATDFNAVPEPSSCALLALCALAGLSRRRRA